MASSSSTIAGYKSISIHNHPYTRSLVLLWNPVPKVHSVSRSKNEISFWGGNKAMVFQYDNRTKRKSFSVKAVVPGAPLPSTPPPSNSIGWIIGMVISVVLPFFTHKWGPLWILKNRIENAVQTVENIVEAVEKVAEEVDKIAEDIADDLPEGNLKNFVKRIEDVAERTAKTADSLDNVIDQVQEAEERLEDIVERVVHEAENSAKDNIVTSIPKEAEISIIVPEANSPIVPEANL